LEKDFSPNMKALIQSLLLGLGIVIATVLPWSALAAANLRVSPQIPWSVPIMAAYLVALLSYLNGRGGPRTTQSSRHNLLRVRWLSGREWWWALSAGFLGVLTLWLVYAAIGGFSHSSTPSQAMSNLSTPILLIAITMGAAVTAIGEEAGFRGYMQATLERRYAPVTAILVTGGAFALIHLSHGAADVLRNGVFYVAVSFVYGFQAYLTKSILPSLVLHFVGDIFVFGLRSGLIHLGMPSGQGIIFLAVGAMILSLGSTAGFVRLARMGGSGRNADLSRSSPGTVSMH
jgi:membrane protease YdiL (CAAX protease family)